VGADLVEAAEDSAGSEGEDLEEGVDSVGAVPLVVGDDAIGTMIRQSSERCHPEEFAAANDEGSLLRNCVFAG